MGCPVSSITIGYRYTIAKGISVKWYCDKKEISCAILAACRRKKNRTQIHTDESTEKTNRRDAKGAEF